MITIILFASKLFFKKHNDEVIHGDVIDANAKPTKRGLLPILLLGAVFAGLLLFVIPRFGINVMGILQKAIAFLPLIRGILPF